MANYCIWSGAALCKVTQEGLKNLGGIWSTVADATLLVLYNSNTHTSVVFRSHLCHEKYRNYFKIQKTIQERKEKFAEGKQKLIVCNKLIVTGEKRYENR